jgi:hypothetical protein
MKRAAKQILSLALLLFAMPHKGQVLGSNPAFPVGWIEAPAPSQDSALQCANYSRHEWSVERSSGINLYDSSVDKRPGAVLPSGFVLTKEMPGRAIVQKVVDGWLVGFNAGEFGGGLWWSDESGRRTRKLTGENVRAFVPRGDAVLVFTGLAHLSIDEGKIYSFTTKDSGALVLIADIGSEPSAAVMGDAGIVFIATHIGVLRLTTDNRLEQLYGNRAMGLLYPNSILEDATGSIVVGMRFYALRLERNGAGYKPVWYIPLACRKTRLKNYDCECVGKP